MTDASGIKVDGLKDLNRALRELGYPQKEITAAAKAAGEAAVNEAKNLVPVRSGRLRNTIRLAATAKGVTIRAGNNTTVQYANPIHWGWFKRHIKPNPFFAKALGYTRQEIYDNYYKQMDDLIKRNGSQVK